MEGLVHDADLDHRVAADTEHEEFAADAGEVLRQGEQLLDVLLRQHVGAGGGEQESVTLVPSAVRREQQIRLDAILFGTEFAKPGVATAHPAMRQSRTP